MVEEQRQREREKRHTRDEITAQAQPAYKNKGTGNTTVHCQFLRLDIRIKLLIDWNHVTRHIEVLPVPRREMPATAVCKGIYNPILICQDVAKVER